MIDRMSSPCQHSYLAVDRDGMSSFGQQLILPHTVMCQDAPGASVDRNQTRSNCMFQPHLAPMTQVLISHVHLTRCRSRARPRRQILTPHLRCPGVPFQFASTLRYHPSISCCTALTHSHLQWWLSLVRSSCGMSQALRQDLTPLP